MSDNDIKIEEDSIQVGDKAIGASTTVQIKLKHLLIMLFTVVSSIGTAYWNVVGKIDSVDTKVEKIKDESLTQIFQQVSTVDGKVQGLVLFHQLDNTSVAPSTNPIHPVNNQPPE